MNCYFYARCQNAYAYADCRWAFDSHRHFSLSLSLLGDYWIRSVSERGASCAILFPRHKRNHILPRCALEGAYSLLSTIHTRPTDSRSTDNLTAEMCWCDFISSRYPTFFDVRVSSADLCRRRVLRDATTGGRQVGLRISSPHLSSQCSFSFFLGHFNRLFFRVTFVPSTARDKSPRQPRHECFFREYITLCVMTKRTKKLLSTLSRDYSARNWQLEWKVRGILYSDAHLTW